MDHNSCPPEVKPHPMKTIYSNSIRYPQACEAYMNSTINRNLASNAVMQLKYSFVPRLPYSRTRTMNLCKRGEPGTFSQVSTIRIPEWGSLGMRLIETGDRTTLDSYTDLSHIDYYHIPCTDSTFFGHRTVCQGYYFNWCMLCVPIITFTIYTNYHCPMGYTLLGNSLGSHAALRSGCYRPGLDAPKLCRSYGLGV